MTGELDLDQLRALSADDAEGTFDAAAHALHVTPSAISQRIKALETRTGRVLVRRARPVTATPSGEVLLRAARQLDVIAADVAEALGEDDGDRAARTAAAPPRTVALAANADSLATWLLPALRDAAAAGPAIAFDIRRDDETRTATLLRDGTVMAAVTAVREPVPGCTVRRLGAMRYRACAAPGFAREHLDSGPIAEALAVAPVVTFDRGDVLQERYLRRRTRRRLQPPRQYVPGSEAFVEAIALGLGWGMVPDLQSRERIAAGALVSFDDGRPIDVALYWQQWRLRSPSLERIAAAVRAAASRALV